MLEESQIPRFVVAAMLDAPAEQTVGFDLGVHVAVGYLDPLHLAPAIVGAFLFVLALALSYPYLTNAATARSAARV